MFFNTRLNHKMIFFKQRRYLPKLNKYSEEQTNMITWCRGGVKFLVDLRKDIIMQLKEVDPTSDQYKGYKI